jgi:hypothetical protein
MDAMQSADAIGCCSSGRFALLTPSQLASRHASTEWLVEGLLPSNGLAAIYGASGTAKSFLALDLAACIASGMDWFGYTTRRRAVVYVALEGHGAFHRRMQAWALNRGIPFPDEVRTVVDAFAINSQDDALALGELIRTCNGARLVIVDTLNRAAPGADENTSHDMSKIVAGAVALQNTTGGLIMLIHHSGKDATRGLRGHSSLHAALDCVIEAERDGARRSWRVAKSKDGEDGARHGFDLKVVQLGDDLRGNPMSSCVVVAAEGVCHRDEMREPRGANQRLVYRGLSELLQKQKLHNEVNSDNFPCGISFDDAVTALKSRLSSVDPKHQGERVRDALERLIETGHVVQSGNVLTVGAAEV